MAWVTSGVVLLAGLIGAALTVVSAPGIWLVVASGVACRLWRPELISWWTIGATVLIAAVAEALELVSSAYGAARTGGGRAGAVGAIVGTVLGAIVGTGLVPVVGTVIGAVAGAALGAIVAERGVGGRSWRHSARVGSGAAVGRVAALGIKLAGIVLIWAVLTIDIILVR